MKRFLLALLTVVLCSTSVVLAQSSSATKSSAIKSGTSNLVMTRAQLLDKIKGGWAGQTIGVTFGGPMEFRYNGTMIQEYQPIPWYDGYLKKTMIENPGLYDDIYMDLTFVDIFEKEGLDAPASSFAKAYANAEYPLWHANQVGRYNILNGIDAPASGHWKNNPHADCIDYQIEADFAGLMSPGMPNAASAISDRIGHIMNYGDGWYGGVFIGAMYALAFADNNIERIVTGALKTIPKESKYYKCISDVLASYRKYPNDWTQTWLQVQKEWSSDIGCPDGVFRPYNIDATVNSAYVVIGLLYGGGDFTKTMYITTRCGQDADCNPSSSGGILGTILGYDKIPAYWKQGLKEAESIDFKYTTLSLEDVYNTGFKHALQNIQRNGGKVNEDNVTIPLQIPTPVALEQSFSGHFPVERRSLYKTLDSAYALEFEGNGFVITGETASWDSKTTDVIEVEMRVDGGAPERTSFPTNFKQRRYDLFWKYDLPPGKHKVDLKIVNPSAQRPFKLYELIVYVPSAKTGITRK